MFKPDKHAIIDCARHGLDPAKMIPNTAAQKWLASEAGRRALQAKGE